MFDGRVDGLVLLLRRHSHQSSHQRRGDSCAGLRLLRLIAAGVDGGRLWAGEAGIDVFVIVVGRGLIATVGSTGEVVLGEGGGTWAVAAVHGVARGRSGGKLNGVEGDGVWRRGDAVGYACPSCTRGHVRSGDGLVMGRMVDVGVRTYSCGLLLYILVRLIGGSLCFPCC